MVGMLSIKDDLRLALDRAAFARSSLGIQPDSWQERLLRSGSDRILLNCSRQSGKSTMAALIALHRALYHPGSLILCLAPALRQSQELFGKIVGFYRDLGRPIPATVEQKLTLELANGSRIVTLPGTERTIRGFSNVGLLIIDEASRIDDALYYFVRPMLAVSGGAMMMLSSPYGRRGVFYDEWTSLAQVGGAREGWERYEVKATQVPRISEAFLAEERASLPPRVYRQEYECSFEDTQDQVFSTEDIQAAIDESVTPLFASGAGA